MTLSHKPNLPEYKAQAAPIYWEPVMGSGERIVGAIAALGADGQVSVAQAVSPKTMRVLFATQGRSAVNILHHTCQAAAQHLRNEKTLDNWQPPFTGIFPDQMSNYLGENLRDVIWQVKTLYSAFANHGETEDAEEAFQNMNDQTLRARVSMIIRRKGGLSAEKLLTQSGKIQIRDAGKIHWLDVPIRTDARAGTIVSAWYKSTTTIEANILRAQSNLQAMHRRYNVPTALFIGRPYEGLPKNFLNKVDEQLDEIIWRMDQSEIEVHVHDSAERIADGVLNWAAA